MIEIESLEELDRAAARADACRRVINPQVVESATHYGARRTGRAI